MEVPEESFHWSSWDSRTCYPRRAFIQGLTDDQDVQRKKMRSLGHFSSFSFLFSWMSISLSSPSNHSLSLRIYPVKISSKDEPTWRCQQNPFIRALGIQEPVIPGEPSIEGLPVTHACLLLLRLDA